MVNCDCGLEIKFPNCSPMIYQFTPRHKETKIFKRHSQRANNSGVAGYRMNVLLEPPIEEIEKCLLVTGGGLLALLRSRWSKILYSCWASIDSAVPSLCPAYSPYIYLFPWSNGFVDSVEVALVSQFHSIFYTN